MILLLGANGYVGQGFATALQSRKGSFVPLTPEAFDYTRFELLFDYVRNLKPDFIINAASYVESWENNGHQELDRMAMLRTNVLLPQTVARVCALTKTPWGHISSGGIYRGAKVCENGELRVETDLDRPHLRRLFDAHPEKFLGFNEHDEPNRSFHSLACSFYSGTKALAEEVTRDQDHNYTWRLRLPFSEKEDPGNFLCRLVKSESLRDEVNSLSHLDECVRACLDLWDARAAYGVYNIVNPGAVATREIVAMIQRTLKPLGRLQRLLCANDDHDAEPAGLSSCVLDNSKLRRAGVKLRPVREALQQALARWQSESFGIVRALARNG
jgi:dTDP-4-dehydrorhamnose reductase